MFKRFDASTDISTSTQVKASVLRGIKASILESHPHMEDGLLDLLLPKKQPLMQYKVGPHLMLYSRCFNSNNEDDNYDYNDEDETSDDYEPVFFQSRDGPVLPTLRLVHSYPDLKFRHVTVDKGAIPFVIGGANIMCPGLTNPGGYMPEDGDGDDSSGLDKGDGVVIFAEGKENALAIGIMKMSSKHIRSKNKGIGVEVVHFLGDGLYQTKVIS